MRPSTLGPLLFASWRHLSYGPSRLGPLFSVFIDCRSDV